MATVVTYDGGLRRVEFALSPNGPRKAVRLGRVSAKVADAWKAKLETIIADRALHRPHDPEVTAWLAKLDETMLARLRAVGLADGVGVSKTTLGAFLERCFATLTIKPATRTFYGHTRRNLETYFGTGRVLGDISAADADGWRAWLVEHEGLSPATVARRVIAARTLWRRAQRWKLASESPFDGVKAGHQMNESRKAFVPRDVIAAVLDACPDQEWRCIVALARYGGLRTPSETYLLRWADIDWEQSRIRVASPKTEHHEGYGERIIPLFPELRAELLPLFTDAPAGTVYVVATHRLAGMNLRQQLLRIIRRAGVATWPKLFHNLRASRETELMRGYDLATVCKWIGNSPAIAARHYATSVDLDSDFARAAGRAAEAQQKAQQSPAVGDGQGMTPPKPEVENTRENSENVACGQPCAAAVGEGGWAARDSNP